LVKSVPVGIGKPSPSILKFASSRKTTVRNYKRYQQRKQLNWESPEKIYWIPFPML
jgi:hypothetical protein